MTNKFDLPSHTLPTAGYITTAKRNRLVRLAISSILITKGGNCHTLAHVSRQVGCSSRTVASVKNEMDAMGLLGSILLDAPIPRAAPEASFTNMESRLFSLQGWFRDLNEDGVADDDISKAMAETQELLRIVRRKGSMPRHFAPVIRRLEILEELYHLPKYDLELLAA